MAMAQRLQAFLDDAKVKYTVAKHQVVYTAQEIAAAQHVPGRQLAKCVLVKTDRGSVLAVLPAIHRVDLKRLKALLGAKTLTIANEADIRAQFPDVEVGAMSPFGNLYGVPVAVDRELGQSETIVFNAGTHADTVSLRYADFVSLAKPTAGAFGQHVSGRPGGKKPAAKRAHKTSARRAVARARKKKTARKPSARSRAKRR